jgi:hypothetical protein
MPDSGTDLRKACEERLRALLPDDERVVAVGTTETRADLQGDISTAGRWRFLVITQRRVVHADWGRDGAPHEEIVFEKVAGWADGEQYHRYAMTLEHPPLARRVRVPAHRFLWFRWGTRVVDVDKTETSFVFSHRDTAAAQALRELLERHNHPPGSLELEEKTRSERTAGSPIELVRKN